MMEQRMADIRRRGGRVAAGLRERMERSSAGERALIGGTTVVLLAVFLPWFSTSCAGGCDGTDLAGSIDGVHGLGLLTLLGLLAVIGLWSLRSYSDRIPMRIPALPLRDTRVYAAGGAVEIAGVLLAWMEYRGAAGDFLSVSVHPSVGWVLTLLGGAATICGGLLLEGERR